MVKKYTVILTGEVQEGTTTLSKLRHVEEVEIDDSASNGKVVWTAIEQAPYSEAWSGVIG